MTNAKHSVAVERTADRITELRSEIHTQLDALLELYAQLENLTDTHQPNGGFGYATAEAREARARQDAADRAAARGIPTHTGRSFVTGLGWLNGATTKVPGAHPAPVVMPVVSVLAEIRFTLQHHVNRLTRAAINAGACIWPRPHVDVHGNVSLPGLADTLRRLVDAWHSRPGLEALRRDLGNLETRASDVVHGPARTNYDKPCPWCGRDSLVIHRRELGRSSAFIRCDGRHECQCNDDFCECRRPGSRYRHEWENSGRAAHNWNQLIRLINAHQETLMLETKATAARERALALHQEIGIYPRPEDCLHPEKHERDWTDALDGNGLICMACGPLYSICEHCSDPDLDPVQYPCDTVRALDLDQPAEDEQEAGR